MRSFDYLPLATIPAPRNPADPAGLAPGVVPVNDDTKPCPQTAEQIRELLLAKHGRTRLLSAKETA